ncbi:MAG TPA: SAM-dependent chlorinase/fluorinase, partial [Syntrophorhabdaceae bacterium]|nr:SAM-dependent chlorinase/fluorinase [Syntrophorhabdaceae bacterium]
LTDFGTTDTYVGAVKGVILSINSHVRIVDITHEAVPQNVEEGAFLIEEYYRFFPTGTIHVCIIDPTVGSTRRPLVVCKDGYFFIGPDNGLLTNILDGAEIRSIENRDLMLGHISNTFHGRDIFAPAAAHISLGVEPFMLGQEIADPIRLRGLTPSVERNQLTGKIMRFDHFGNAITNIRSDFLHRFISDRDFRIQVGSITINEISKSFFEHELTCIEGSSGYIEFAYFKGSFQSVSGLTRNDPVRITRI